MTENPKKQLRTALLEAVRPGLKNNGFILRAKLDSFIRRTDGIADDFQLVFLDGKPGYRIQPNVGVRIERVEEIFHQTSGFEAKYQKSTVTIGGSIGNIMKNDNRECEFLLESEDEIGHVSENIVRVFREFALPYFERFHSLRAIDAALNENPIERTPHRVAPSLRESTGLIVAKLVGRPDYDHLVDLYSTIMRDSHKGFYHKKFEALVKSLGSIEGGSGLGARS